jgi:hypothetical protein
VRHEPKKISKLRDVQLTILISIGHLELRLNEAQQLSLADLAFVAAEGALVRVFGHSR